MSRCRMPSKFDARFTCGNVLPCHNPDHRPDPRTIKLNEAGVEAAARCAFGALHEGRNDHNWPLVEEHIREAFRVKVRRDITAYLSALPEADDD